MATSIVAMSLLGVHLAMAQTSGYAEEIPTWTKQGMLAGATTGQQNCSMHAHVWVVDEQNGFCIRFFRNEIAFTKGPAILFFGGDFLGSDWDGTGHPIRPIFAGNVDGAALFAVSNEFVRRPMRLPFIYISRPGVTGSSGDQKTKFQPQESRIANAVIEALKSRFGIKKLVLAGQSGGAALVANILPKRSDVKCAVMGSGAVALWQYASSFIARDIYQQWE